jgi:tripartite-type tricarboxylate transporter receptor subunit TctC
MMNNHLGKHFLAGLALAVTALCSTAQTAWPADKPITMIVPFPPGGVADTVARPVAEALGKELKQTVIVENRVGAGGALGIGMAARAPADGYTVLLSLSSISILPEADRSRGHRAQHGGAAHQGRQAARIGPLGRQAPGLAA